MNTKYLAEERLGAVTKKDFFELCESRLTVITNEISQPDIAFKISEPGWQIVFLGMKRSRPRAQASRRCIDTSIFGVCFVHWRLLRLEIRFFENYLERVFVWDI